MRPFFPFVLCGAFMAVPAITGCEREVARETTTVRESDGDIEKKETVVTQQPDGSVQQKTTEKEVEN